MGSSGELESVDPFGVDGDGGEDVGEAGGVEVNGGLPADVRAVWGADPTAALLVREWGVDAFRGSWLHRMAVLEAARAPRPRLRPDLRRGSK